MFQDYIVKKYIKEGESIEQQRINIAVKRLKTKSKVATG